MHVLNPDKDLPTILYQFLYSNKKFDFSLINDIEKYFFTNNLFSFEKKLFGIEKNLFGRWDFNSSISPNLMGLDYRIEVSRKEEIPDSAIKEDLKQLNLKEAVIVDLEFFEFAQWAMQFDISQKLITLDRDSIKFNELRDYIKENALHIEKEKIHLKIIKCKNKNGKDIYLPLYIALGTNEPFGLAPKQEGHKPRWYKLSLDTEEPYLEEGKIKILSTDKKIINQIVSNDKVELIENDNSCDAKTKTFTVINRSCKNIQSSHNDLLQGYIKYNYSIKDNAPVIKEPISIIEPYYNKENVRRIDIWRQYIDKKYIFDELIFLLNKSQEEYENFFELFNSPYRTISQLGTIKTVELIQRKYKKILTDQESDMLNACVAANNINTIAGDLYKLGIDSNRNRISSLLIQVLLLTGRFKQHLDGNPCNDPEKSCT